jgi:hypothetical protein
MPRGGKRPGAGRKPGIPTRKTVTRRLIAEQAAAKGVTPLDVMLDNMRDAYAQARQAEQTLPSQILDINTMSPKDAFDAVHAAVRRVIDFRRIAEQCASDAAPFIHPRLSAIEQKTELKGDTLATLLQAIDGRTTGIATGAENDGSALAPEQPLRHH